MIFALLAATVSGVIAFVPSAELPDLLTAQDGSKITTAAQVRHDVIEHGCNLSGLQEPYGVVVTTLCKVPAWLEVAECAPAATHHAPQYTPFAVAIAQG